MERPRDITTSEIRGRRTQRQEDQVTSTEGEAPKHQSGEGKEWVTLELCSNIKKKQELNSTTNTSYPVDLKKSMRPSEDGDLKGKLAQS